MAYGLFAEDAPDRQIGSAGNLSFEFNSLPPGNLFSLFLFLLFFFNFFRKELTGIPSECQTDWFKIRPDVFVGPICL